MQHDPLSDVLSSVRLRGAIFYYVSCARSWVAETPPSPELADALSPGAEPWSHDGGPAGALVLVLWWPRLQTAPACLRHFAKPARIQIRRAATIRTASTIGSRRSLANSSSALRSNASVLVTCGICRAA